MPAVASALKTGGAASALAATASAAASDQGIPIGLPSLDPPGAGIPIGPPGAGSPFVLPGHPSPPSPPAMSANPYRPLSRLRDGGAVPALFLLGSHALATWGVRTWEFSVALILMALWPTSLALVAAYGIIDSLACIILGVGDCCILGSM